MATSVRKLSSLFEDLGDGTYRTPGGSLVDGQGRLIDERTADEITADEANTQALLDAADKRAEKRLRGGTLKAVGLEV